MTNFFFKRFPTLIQITERGGKGEEGKERREVKEGSDRKGGKGGEGWGGGMRWAEVLRRGRRGQWVREVRD